MSRARPQRGGAYVLVLITSVVVTAMALSALTLRGAQQRSATTAAEIAAAAYLAWSGLELALERMNTNPNWRSTTMDSAWTAPVTIGPGSLALRVRDPADGDLADSNNEPVLVRSVGVVGSARQILEAQFAPGESPLSCVQVAAWARSGITLSKCTVTCDQIVSTNGSAYADAATLTGTIEAASFSSKGVTLWNPVPLATPRTGPAASVFDWYVTVGTSIPVASLTRDSTKRVLQNVLLSPQHNPYGTGLNPRGVYVIDAANNPIVIRNCRIVGTLVILNQPSSGPFAVEGSVTMDPADETLPALMIEGPMMFNFSSAPLSEVVIGVNFNPPELGEAGGNTVLVDTFASRIRGIVYVSGQVTIKANSPTFEGSLVCDDSLNFESAATLRYTAPGSSVTPGFTGPSWTNQMRPVAGTIRRVLE